jgi:hypothetical protein
MDTAQNIVALPNVKTATKSRRSKFGHHDLTNSMRRKYKAQRLNSPTTPNLAAAGVSLVRNVGCVGASYSTDGFHIWTVDEVRQFEERHPVGTKAVKGGKVFAASCRPLYFGDYSVLLMS